MVDDNVHWSEFVRGGGMKIAVIGSNGQLGHDVVRAFTDQRDEVSPLTHEHIELSSLESVVECLRATQAEVVVNTAAMHNVENCEQQPGRAHEVNVCRCAESRNSYPRLRVCVGPCQHGLCI